MSFKCFKYIKKRVKYYEFGVFGVYKKRTTWKPKQFYATTTNILIVT